MAPPRRPSARRHRRSAPRRTRSPASAVVPRPPRRTEHVPLPDELPHAHIVCRVCGRIQGVGLTELDRHLLTQLAAGRPDGWSVERIAFSLTGACRRCREGPPTA